MNKAGKRKRKSKLSKLLQGKSKTTIVIASIMAIILLVFVFCISYVVVGTYKGLGKSTTIPFNTYSNYSYYTKDGFKHYEDSDYKSTIGIDVSTFQGTIDWDKVKTEKLDFAMIRIGYRGSSEGTIQADDMYKTNLKGAKSAGLKVGVYFFSQANTTDEAVEEAKYVIRHIRGRGITYPVVFDMEYMENDRISNLTDKERTQIADAFCTIIKNNGYTPMIYGNQKWLLRDINLSFLTKYYTWLAHYSDTTNYPYTYKMWQYSDSGKISGIKNHADLDICYIKK